MAVYTKINREQLIDLLEDYDLGTLESFEGIAQGVSNTNYHVITSKGRYILTLFEEPRTDVAGLPFFFAYAQQMGQAGIRCPQPVPDKSSQLFTSLEDKAAAFVTFVEGRDIKPADITPEICYQIGELTAAMHEAADGFDAERANTMGLTKWNKLASLVKEKADQVTDGLAGVIADELRYLEKSWPKDLPRGAVHADIFPDNVFIKDGNVHAVIDFYFACTDFFMFDLAIVINAWCFDYQSYEFQKDRFDALMAGYQETRLLSEQEKQALPILLRGAAMRILVTRTYDWVFHDPDDMVEPHDPREYLSKLRFHQDNEL